MKMWRPAFGTLGPDELDIEDGSPSARANPLVAQDLGTEPNVPTPRIQATKDIARPVLLAGLDREETDILSTWCRRTNRLVQSSHSAPALIELCLSRAAQLLVISFDAGSTWAVRLVSDVRRYDAHVPILCLVPSSTLGQSSLAAGANDFIRRPVDPEELLARAVGRVVAAVPPSADGDARAFGRLRIDGATHEVSIGCRALQLTPTEFRLLRYLVENRARAVSQQEIVREVLGSHGAESNARFHVRHLREKLMAVGGDIWIQTVRGGGYILRATAGQAAAS